MPKFKAGDKIKIVSKSLNSKLVKSFWPNMVGYIKDVRYNGKSGFGYRNEFYYSVNKQRLQAGGYHFLEKDLRFPDEEDIIKEFNWNDFKI